MKQVKCKSGIQGHQGRLQANYDNFEQFQTYSDMYGLAKRLGFKPKYNVYIFAIVKVKVSMPSMT